MKRFFQNIINNYNIILKFVIIIASIFCAVYFMPQKNSFNYIYEIGNTWNYNDLVAPFDFPINKSANQISSESKEIQENAKLYYYVDKNVGKNQIEKFNEALTNYSYGNSLDTITANRIKLAFANISNSGIITYDEFTSNKNNDFVILLVSGSSIKKVFLKDVYTVQSANEEFSNICSKIKNIKRQSEISSLAEKYFVSNIFLDINKTNLETKKLIDAIPASYDKIHKGDIIILEGAVVNKDVANILQSLENTYSFYADTPVDNKLAKAAIYIVICVSFMAYLTIIKSNILKNNKSFLLVVLTISIILTCITLALYGGNQKNVYMVPICMVPIIFRAFYDYKVATWGILLTTFAAAIVVPDPFYFCLSNIITGIIVVAFMSKLEKRSQYFIAPIVSFTSYIIIYAAYNISITNTITSIHFPFIEQYLLNSVLIITSYPLIFFIEKIFGFPTDISLIELSNTNNSLLRRLSTEAPGTFQHSIQTANLSENAAREIGANVLLARVGALYHDIGKLDAPYYFTENQTKNTNPHEDLLPNLSAKILISHVVKGVEIATKHHLPEVIKDFIRSHHGTRFTSFFYRNAIEQFGKENIDEKDFKYRGPKPFSKETAIVMMADSIEAASKSLQDTDDQQLTYLVNNVIGKQIAEEQFSNADISFKEIEIIKKVFISSLKSSFHLRIKYPSNIT